MEVIRSQRRATQPGGQAHERALDDCPGSAPDYPLQPAGRIEHILDRGHEQRVVPAEKAVPKVDSRPPQPPMQVQDCHDGQERKLETRIEKLRGLEH